MEPDLDVRLDACNDMMAFRQRGMPDCLIGMPIRSVSSFIFLLCCSGSIDLSVYGFEAIRVGNTIVIFLGPSKFATDVSSYLHPPFPGECFE